MISPRKHLRVLLLLVLGALWSVPTYATVTYEGQNGVGAQIFATDTNYGAACSGCHSSGGGTTPYFDSETNVYAFTSNGTTYNGVPSGSYYIPTGCSATSPNTATAGFACMVYRINQGQMPASGALTAAGMNLATAWQSGGFLKNAAPQISNNGASSVSAYGATLNGNVYENGLSTTVYFKYSTVQSTVTGGGGTALSGASAPGTGGGLSSDGFSRALSGLTCGTTYYYAAYASNSDGSVYDNSGSGFTTGACTHVTSASSGNATAGTTFTFNATAAGGSGSYTWSITSGGTPAGLSINASTGQITWTNVPQQSTPQVITIQATDGTSSGSQSFTINITQTPVITSGDGASPLIGGKAYPNYYQATATNPNSATLTYSLNAAAVSAGMTINSSTGLVSWTTPNVGSTTAYNGVGVSVSDGVHTPDTHTWNVTVNPYVAPAITGFSPPTSAVQGTLYTYTATVTTTTGYTATWSLQNAPAGMTIGASTGTINWTPTNAQSGSFGPITVKADDGRANDTKQFSVFVEIPPKITTSGDVTVNSTGYYTPVKISATAVGFPGGTSTPIDVWVNATANCSAVSKQATPTAFRPGVNTVIWMTQDSYGNCVTATQTVKVVPLASLGGTVSVVDGNSATLYVTLNGTSPQYPVVLNVAMGGTAITGVDYSSLTGVVGGGVGTVTINSGTSAAVTLNTIADGVVEPDKTFTLTLTSVGSGGAVLSSQLTGTFVLTNANLPPAVSLQVLQDTGSGSQQRDVVYLNQNTVTVNAVATDPNGNPLTYDWSLSDAALGIVGTTGSVTVSPAALTAGKSYSVVVRVSDGTNVTQQSVTITAVATAPSLTATDTDGDGLADNVEGTVDANSNGLLDYLDPVSVSDAIALNLDSSAAGRLRIAQVDAGLTVSAGPFAVALQGGGIAVPPTSVVGSAGSEVDDPADVEVGAIYDAVVGGLDPNSRIADIVLPLTVAIPPSATFRVFMSGTWATFVTTATDNVSAAAAVNGQCPSPGSPAWQPGLVTGDMCIRLTVSDGGPNDADGLVNGSIRITGAVAVSRATAAAATAPDATKGGAIELLFLSLLALAGFRTRRHGK